MTEGPWSRGLARGPEGRLGKGEASGFSLASVVRPGQGCFGCGLSGLNYIGRWAKHGLCPLAGHKEGETPIPVMKLGEQTCHLIALP